MPAGEVKEPISKDGFLKTGYLRRYDHYDDDGLPSTIPVANAQTLLPGDPVIFDVVHTSINENGNIYFTPIAIIREEVDKTEWEEEWNNAEKQKDKLKIKPNSIILRVSDSENLKIKVKDKIDELRGKKAQEEFKPKLKQLK